MNKIITGFIIMFCVFSCGAKEKTVEVDDNGASIEGSEAIVQANNEFAFDLYSRLSKENADDNIFYSPYSILVALTMTYEGAKGKTAEEMQSVFHIPEDANVRRPNSGHSAISLF
jgi:serpin B